MYNKDILFIREHNLEFVFDVAKSLANFEKHGIAFKAAQRIWADPHRVVGPGFSHNETRWLVVGQVEGKVWTACFTYRGSYVRLISCRRARAKEEQVYEEGK